MHQPLNSLKPRAMLWVVRVFPRQVALIAEPATMTDIDRTGESDDCSMVRMLREGIRPSPTGFPTDLLQRSGLPARASTLVASRSSSVRSGLPEEPS